MTTNDDARRFPAGEMIEKAGALGKVGAMNGRDMMDELDDLFAEARLGSARAGVPDALMARVLADAAALQPVAQPLRQAADAGAGSWRELLAGILGGGRRAMAGFALAGLAGLVIGVVVQPVDPWFDAQAGTITEFQLMPDTLQLWADMGLDEPQDAHNEEMGQ